MFSFLNKENENQKKIAKDVLSEINKQFNGKIVTNISEEKNYCRAEEYHQDYKKKTPNDIYIMRVSNPRISKFKMDFKEIIK